MEQLLDGELPSSLGVFAFTTAQQLTIQELQVTALHTLGALLHTEAGCNAIVLVQLQWKYLQGECEQSVLPTTGRPSEVAKEVTALDTPTDILHSTHISHTYLFCNAGKLCVCLHIHAQRPAWSAK